MTAHDDGCRCAELRPPGVHDPSCHDRRETLAFAEAVEALREDDRRRAAGHEGDEPR